MMMKRSSGLSRAAVRAAAKPAALRGANTRQATDGDASFVLDLPTSLDAFEASAEVIEATERTIKFPVICLFNEAEDGTRNRFRFVTSGLKIKDKSGVYHRIFTDLEPIVDEESAKKLEYRTTGILTVKGAFMGTNDLKPTPFIRNGAYNGDVKYELTCAATFVKFEVIGAHTGAVDDPDAAEQQG